MSPTPRRLAASAACVTLLGLSATAPAAGAQIMSNPGQWYTNNQIYSMRVFNGVVGNSLLGKGAKKGGKAAPGGAKKKAAPAAADPTVYKESAARSLAKTLAKKTANPAEAEKAFASFLQLYRQTARKDGFPANDLAYAFEYFVVNNYQIAHDLVDLPIDKDPRARRAIDGFDRIAILGEKRTLQVTAYQERAVYDQFRALLRDNPQVRAMTDAQKQEATELLAILVGVNFNAYLHGVNAENEQAADAGRRMAREGLEKLLGAPLDKVRITNTGVAVP
ncbi:MAG TPA: DUF6683 family protein [Armatimonadaceae bacterium]|nr:DUF6683 family protein [Armatimonadaceae bacterium]